MAIDIAKDRYIAYIDSDDDVELDFINFLYNNLKKFNCKISICTHNIVKNKK